MSSAAAAAAADADAAAADAPAGRVFVKRSNDARARFAEVEIFEGDTVTRLAKRASHELDWGVGAAYVEFFLVPDGLVRQIQLEPKREAGVLVDANLCLATDALAEAGIRNRSCLLARLLTTPAAAPGECVRVRVRARSSRVWRHSTEHLLPVLTLPLPSFLRRWWRRRRRQRRRRRK